jgi:hypothetical protein
MFYNFDVSLANQITCLGVSLLNPNTMKLEKMVMLTGKQYQEIKGRLENEPSLTLNVGSDSKPEMLTITDIYLDTDPEFTRNIGHYAQLPDDKLVQVVVEYDGEPQGNIKTS